MKKNNLLSLAAKFNQAHIIVAITEGSGLYALAVDFKNIEGKTALMIACENNKPEAAKSLLNTHASLAETDISGFTPWLCALNSNNPDMLQILLDHCPLALQQHMINQLDNSGLNALHLALIKYPKIIDKLIELEINVNAKGSIQVNNSSTQLSVLDSSELSNILTPEQKLQVQKALIAKGQNSLTLK